MIRLPRYGSTSPDGRKSATFDPINANELDDQLPAYDPHSKINNFQNMTTTTYHD